MTTPIDREDARDEGDAGQRDRLAPVGDLELDASRLGQRSHESRGCRCCDRREQALSDESADLRLLSGAGLAGAGLALVWVPLMLLMSFLHQSFMGVRGVAMRTVAG